MTSVLLVAEHAHSHIKPATLNAVTAARALGDVDILVAGHNCAATAAAAAKISGIHKVLCADDAVYAHQLAENTAALVATVATGYDYILSPATTTGKNMLPRVGALLDVQPLSDVCGIADADTFVRPIYAGNAFATVRSTDKVKVMTVRTTAFDPAPAEGGNAPVENIAAATASDVTSFVSQQLTTSERPELTAARIIVSGGRGMGSGENFRLIESLADKLNAAVGASRAAVDAGFVPNDYQVGQTGKVVAPELYIAVGISGAIQHLAGMKDSKVIVAINKDGEAPIFQIADYGLVQDLFTALPEFEKALDS
jgi:electron transfer flavoprotein alpha subunit